MDSRLTWTLKTIFISGLIVLLNYPITYAICHDITAHYTTLITTILIISLLYGFSVLCGPHHFHAVLIGLLAGNLLALLTWIVSFRDIVFHLTDQNKLSVFYSLGVFFPTMFQFFLNFKQDKSDTKKLHIILTSLITGFLFGYLLYKLFHRQFYDLGQNNVYHFLFGFSAGIITALIIRFVMTKNILVFQKLYLYLEVMAKPIVAFFLGYLLIMFTFAGIYTLAYFANNTIFTHLQNDTFGELMFYSFCTMTGMSFSVVEPQHPVTFFLTTVEHFLGLVWMTVVFAAALAHLQLPFRRISQQLESAAPEEENKKPS